MSTGYNDDKKIKELRAEAQREKDIALAKQKAQEKNRSDLKIRNLKYDLDKLERELAADKAKLEQVKREEEATDRQIILEQSSERNKKQESTKIQSEIDRKAKMLETEISKIKAGLLKAEAELRDKENKLQQVERDEEALSRGASTSGKVVSFALARKKQEQREEQELTLKIAEDERKKREKEGEIQTTKQKAA